MPAKPSNMASKEAPLVKEQPSDAAGSEVAPVSSGEPVQMSGKGLIVFLIIIGLLILWAVMAGNVEEHRSRVEGRSGVWGIIDSMPGKPKLPPP